MKKLLPLIFIALFLLPHSVFAQTPEEGAAIFQQKCTACHTVGGGNLAGPDLQGVVTQRERDWLIRWMMKPDVMLAEGDPIAAELLAQFNNVPMPNLGLTEADAAALLAYLENPAAVAGGAVTAVSLPAGDLERGRALFLGQQPLANGGPACLSCHSISDHGTLGGGTLGPDLTRAAMNYGEAGLAATLVSLPFPTMQGVFDNAPLSNQEAADLYAFLVDQDLHAAPQQADLLFVVIGLIGSVGLMAVGHFTWRTRQNSGIRQTLVNQSKLS
jgi:mono/diheme cytochrome c family protein